MCWAGDHRPDRFLPYVAVGNMVAFKIVADGEPKESRIHRVQLFHQVDAVTVRAVVIGRWKERHEIEPKSRWFCDCHLEVVVRRNMDGSGFQSEGVLLPFGRDA